jgi:hypothetical protein
VKLVDIKLIYASLGDIWDQNISGNQMQADGTAQQLASSTVQNS